MTLYDGTPIRYGRAEGGPYNHKDIAHHGDVYHVALDAFTRKAIPGIQPTDDPDIKFGKYLFQEGKWIWQT